MATGGAPTTRYGIKNTFRPTFLVPKPYGWTSAPGYNRADIPTAWVDQASGLTQEQLAQQFAYEWLESNKVGPGYSNPPFVSGAAGRLHPLLRDTNGQPARILRGFIRRAQFNNLDQATNARLYFMYNPETIQRQYVSYLDQGALDPFNTVFQSGNLVAPPSFMNFSFDLFFDRQEEATDPNHPGVFVDYQFFDLVVRNVVPQDPNATSNTLPDNGVMMVNPTDITVVFSPQITVQGRPLNASVIFEKFTHRMTPYRMRISLEMRVVYFGPMREMTEYKMEQVEFISEAAVPDDADLQFTFTYSDLVDASGAFNGATGYAPSAAALGNYAGQVGLTSQANAEARAAAYQWAVSHVTEGQTTYQDEGPGRTNLPASADASGLVYQAWSGIGKAAAIDWTYAVSVENMVTIWQYTHWRTAQLIVNWDSSTKANAQNVLSGQLGVGDLLIRWNIPGLHNTVCFIAGYDGAKIRTFDAAGPSYSPQVGHHLRDVSAVLNDFNFVIRPTPVGSDMSANVVSGTSPSSGVDEGYGVEYGPLVKFGHGEMTLRQQAANSFLQVEAIIRAAKGSGIPLSGASRTQAAQRAGYESSPDRFANPDTTISKHVKGIAVDIDQGYTLEDPLLINTFTNAGWFRRGKKGNWFGGAYRNEPWHWSYKEPG